MQILTSGSFVKLENQEKVEQLVFTARAIADSAAETGGFAASEENNQNLAREIWAGAEYMTLEHERARLENIFVQNFLDRLREITPATQAVAMPETIENQTAETVVEKVNAERDEFLGFVGETTDGENRKRVEAETETAESFESLDAVEIASPPVENASCAAEENFEIAAADAAEAFTPETAKAESVEARAAEMIEPEAAIENEIAETSPAQSIEKSPVEAIALAEKEPYRFDDCTVTATIQLLPTSGGIRKTVVSVRTHDFAPQISVVELNGETTPDKIAPVLAAAFERYKTDLPVKVMDKMKREKSVGKKRANNATVAASPARTETKSAVATTAAATTATTQTADNQTASSVAAAGASPISKPDNAKTTAKKSQPVDSAQGSLFGF